MKRSKLLLPLLSSLSIVPCITTITSCNDNIGAKNVADAIFKTKDAQNTTNFTNSLKSLSEDDRKREIVYDLFGSFNLKGKYSLATSESIADLYKSETVGIKVNITKAELNFSTDGNDLLANFLGYVSFVFLKDHEPYKTNDYVMLTFDIDNQKVSIDNNNCSLKYEINDKTIQQSCIGFAKVRKQSKEVMQYFTYIDTNEYEIKNYSHFVKQ